MRPALGVFVAAIAALLAAPATADADSAEATPARPKLVILLSEAGPAGTRTSFGSTGTDDIDALKNIAKQLRDRGFDLISAAGTRVTRVTSTEEAGGAVIGDAAALDLARQLGAGAALVIGMVASPDGRVRGTPFLGAQVRAAARLLDASSGQTVATADAREAGWGDDAAAATGRASLSAAVEVGPSLARAAARRWPAATSGLSGAAVGVSISGAESWAPIAEIIRQLALTRGIDAVHPREVRGGDVKLDVETMLPASQVARAIKKARLDDNTSLSARVSGGEVIVKVR
jgi:hypothetical protein